MTSGEGRRVQRALEPGSRPCTMPTWTSNPASIQRQEGRLGDEGDGPRPPASHVVDSAGARKAMPRRRSAGLTTAGGCEDGTAGSCAAIDFLRRSRSACPDEARAVVAFNRHDAEEVAGLALPVAKASRDAASSAG